MVQVVPQVRIEIGQGRMSVVVWKLALVGVLTLAASARAAEWKEEDFAHKEAHPYVVLPSKDLHVAETVIGNVRFYRAAKGDTFLDLARFFGLGYNEIRDANPGVDEWMPPESQAVILPTAWILPQGDYQGVVVNIPEMRLYYFHPRKGDSPLLVTTYPLGLGRDDWRTPQGKFKITEKTVNPRWVIPESIKQERIKNYGSTEDFIEGGAPDNPLGKYRLRLTLPLVGIHSTNIPWGVGMQVSHGCVRLYPEDMDKLFPIIPVGTPGEFLYQPVKIGARGGRIYAEVSPDIYGYVPALYREAVRIVGGLGWAARVDERRLRRAVEEQSGVPLDITAGAGDQDIKEEDLRKARERGPAALPSDRGPAVLPSDRG